MFQLHRWERFTVKELGVTVVEDVTQLHIKKYIQERQCVGKEINSTINNNIATSKVFFQYLVSEEFIDEPDKPMRRIKNLKEEKYSNVRDSATAHFDSSVYDYEVNYRSRMKKKQCREIIANC